MPLDRYGPEVDLLYPLPADGETWHHHRVYTNYFGLTVAEHGLGIFFYLRCQPAFPMSQGGVMIWSGMDNVDALDADFFDYEISMPWPTVTADSVTTANGLRLEFVQPGHTIRLTYESNDGNTRLDVLGEAVTPLVARHHVTPGEENHFNGERTPGGFEQFMHYTGEVVVDGQPFAIDTVDVRDRSLHQLRTERQDAVKAPPACWTPMYFGDDLALNHVGFESIANKPVWTEVYDVPPEKLGPVSGWVYSRTADEALAVVETHRQVLEHHPINFMPIHQELEITDESGTVRRFIGRALSTAVLPMWPNTNMRGAVYRWEDESGRTCHTLTFDLWFDRWQRAMKRRRPAMIGS
ncbi:hypothetical protein AWC05_18450 [Mycobacterium florentinum]|uniref:Tyrosine protein kinase n=1 Tax=Mycobacterium florentinum TaxID=292462 RepID=A0A1X1UCK7_MYCFL|nr:hypothetical protein [Mycobacterium florentinum]MCV7412602.1 tyrosine protein kinase [Mycobacterium florentinum]ORV54572.1 hypothetical protein AWC05_18450 [Mycobacterium florentinum]BBX81986.1 hypothetical protein MFLOJ_57730 [Mycobacterium florentinum]